MAHHLIFSIALGCLTATALNLAGADASPPRARHPIIGATSMADDWRCFENGTPLAGLEGADLPAGYGYCEGLQNFAVNDRIHMRTITVAKRHEGHPSQHIIARRSTDRGLTWEPWFDIEPEGPPIASYGGFVRHPRTGQIYFLYNYSPPHDKRGKRVLLPTGEPFRGGNGAPHHIGKAVFRYVDQEGRFGAERHELDIPMTAIDRENAFAGAYRIFLVPPRPHIVHGEDGYSIFCKFGGPQVNVKQGEVFVARFNGYLDNDRLEQLKITLLPPGDHGIRAPDSLCATEAQTMFREGTHWSLIFRTTAGRIGFAETRDLWQTVRTDHVRYQPGGRPLKNPEGPMTIRVVADRTYLAYYNSSYRDGGGHRDQVFISQVKRDGDRIFVSQPEFFHYHNDQTGRESSSTRRLNCPLIRLTPEGLMGQSSDKTGIRRFTIPPAFLDALTNQWTASGVPAHGLALHRAGRISEWDMPRLPALDTGRGWSISFALKLDALSPGQTVFDGWQGNGGVKASVGADGSLIVVMGDGTRTATIASDPQSLTVGAHYITITADGMPALLSMVIDGRFQDGGAARDRGTVWFDHAFTAPVAKSRWTVGAELSGTVSDVFIHDRFLLTSEAVALHRHLAALSP